LDVFCAFAIPLLNTLILLCSGATVTFAHHAITSGRKLEAFWGLVLTITLATVFTALQAFEYVSANFSICDGIYGSTFFMTTGFHGFHVFVGTCFLAICLSRLLRDHFTAQHNFGFEAAVFYWHFVDVVWLFLYIAIYFWGGH
jgi:heme/copper-type cytochrome/quinol oxidase subunit 3